LPAPDLRDVGELIAGLRDGGLPVTMVIDVRHEELPDELSQLAYRIIQEGTTNVLRHAGCAATAVEVRSGGDRFMVKVHNTLAARVEARPGPGGGRGVHGLHRRAAALGGWLTARPIPEGGYELQAVLPLRNPHA
jgi:signal transduction histidine kinase